MEAKKTNAYQLIASARSSDQFPWWEWSIPDNKVTASPLKVTMLGYDESEFERAGYEAYTDLLHPDDYERTMEAMRAHLEGRAPLYEIDYRIRTRSGTYVWYMDRGVITERSEDGAPLVLRGIVINLGAEFERLAFDDAIVRAVRRTLPKRGATQRHPVICAQCGRLTYSQNRWIEVGEHFPAGLEGEISHTLCPDCIRLLYPQVAPTVISRLGYTETDTVSAVLLEPRRVIRDLLIVAFEHEESVELVSTPSSPEALLDGLRRDQVDVVVLSIDGPWAAPFDLVRSICGRFSKAGVLCYCMSGTGALARRALRSGALGFVDSSGSLDDLVSAIRSVAAGKFYVSGRTAETVVGDALSEDEVPHIALSDREFEVMLHLAKRSGVAEIAEAMHLSASTVSTHRRNILGKMNIDKIDNLTRYAVEHELITLDMLL